MKKLFGHTVKPVQTEEEYDDVLQNWDGMEEVIEENTWEEYTDEEYVEQEYLEADESEESWGTEEFEESEESWEPGEFGETEEFEEVEEFGEAEEFEETEEFEEVEEFGETEEFEEVEEFGEAEEFEEVEESREEEEYYAEEENTEEEYTDEEYIESEHLETEEFEESWEPGEFEEAEEFEEVEESKEEEEYYAEEENTEEEYTDEEYIESEHLETEEFEESWGTGEFGEAEEFGETEEFEEVGEFGKAEEFGEAEETGELEEVEEFREEEEYCVEEENTGEEYTDEEYIESEYLETEESEESWEFGEFEGTEESGEYEEAEETGEAEEFRQAQEFGEDGGYYAEEYSESEAVGGEGSYVESLFLDEKKPVDTEDWRNTGSRMKRKRDMGKLDLIDWVMLGTGAAVLIFAFVTGGVFLGRRIKENQVTDFASVGAQLEGISIIGERGLVAVADAEMAKMEAAVLTEEDEGKRGYEETAYDRQISISPIFTSIHQDLKIKFINQKTGKLVPNVPFSVVITSPDGKSVIWSDDDMDGIIYKKNIAAGNYQVTMEALKDSRYSDYMVSTVARTAEVQEEIVYQQVDVANEVKQETEVNVAREDTRQNETVVESVLADTVEWVESKVIGVTYNEIPRSAIPDPAAVAMNRILMPTIEDSGVSGGASEPAAAPKPDPESNRTLTLDRPSATIFLTASVVINAAVDNAVSTEQPVTAESSNTEVAQVSVSGWAVTVTGIGEGSANITVKYIENGEEATAICVVTVKTHPMQDTRTKLKDAAGNQLYVLENNAYREANYADYYWADRFFLKGGVVYSGWQTIEGRIYYFTADGVKVTGEQVIQGAKYQFGDDGALVTGDGAIGIDVSKWNGTIDWNAVKNSGISYVIIRCGYRGSSAGKLIQDSQFEANIKGALAVGLKVGVYFYSQAIDEIEAVEEASMVLEQIKNYPVTYPVFIDVERSGGRGDKIDSNTRTAVCRAFCQTIQNANYTAGIYSNKLWMEQQINMAELNTHKVWLAQYAASPTYSGKYDIWQYKANGSVSGINGNVDLNISYLEN